MDYFSSISQLDYFIDDLFQLPSIISCQQQSIPEDRPVLSLHDDGCNDTKKPKSNGGRTKRSTVCEVKEISCENKKKKVIHRDIEKKRRQDMAALYRSLRSLLPLEYLKGKRSISDHIHQAVNHIKHQEENLQELRVKRDELKRWSNLTSSSNPALGLGRFDQDTVLTVRECSVGVEVVIDTAFKGGLPTSKVLQLLINEGLDMVGCISTKINERTLHSIKCQRGAHGKGINISKLQKRLISSIEVPQARF